MSPYHLGLTLLTIMLPKWDLIAFLAWIRKSGMVLYEPDEFYQHDPIDLMEWENENYNELNYGTWTFQGLCSAEDAVLIKLTFT